MKKSKNNTTLILIAILSFLVGVMLIGAYGLHLRHKEEIKTQTAQEQKLAEQQRQEELAKAQAEEEELEQSALMNLEEE